jgi:hypothetical protein
VDCEGAALHSRQCHRAVPAGILCAMRCNLLNGVASSRTMLQHSMGVATCYTIGSSPECQMFFLRGWPRTKCIFRCRRPAASGECHCGRSAIHVSLGLGCTALHCTALSCPAIRCTDLPCTALDCTGSCGAWTRRRSARSARRCGRPTRSSAVRPVLRVLRVLAKRTRRPPPRSGVDGRTRSSALRTWHCNIACCV